MGEGWRGESRISLSRRLSRRGLRSLVGVAKAFWSAGCEEEGGLLSMSARLLRVETERDSCEGARENAVSDLRLRANGDCDMLAFEKVWRKARRGRSHVVPAGRWMLCCWSVVYVRWFDDQVATQLATDVSSMRPLYARAVW